MADSLASYLQGSSPSTEDDEKSYSIPTPTQVNALKAGVVSLMDQLLSDDDDEDEEEDEEVEDGEEEEEEDEDSNDSDDLDNEDEDDEEAESGDDNGEDNDKSPEDSCSSFPPSNKNETDVETQIDSTIKQDAEENSSADNPPVPTQTKKRKRKKATGDKSKKKKAKKSKPSALRRNIRDIMKENDLDQQTIDAQLEEAERRKRLLEIQKAVEIQRQREKEENDSQLKSLLQMEDEDKGDDVIYLDSSDEGRNRRKDNDIIELSSDEDECLLTKDEDNEVTDEDPNNAGSHINDALNVHDDFGRVLVNIGHPSDEPDIFLAPQIAKYIKKHQIGGVRFLYDNLIESLSRFHSSPGFGCILAHSMGLGKTIQMISFVDVFLRCAKAKTVLLIVPINTLQNWLAEFNMWCPTKEIIGDMSSDDVIPRPFEVFILNDNYKSTGTRAKVIEEWYKKGGVLLMGYEMYRLLSSRRGHIASKLKKTKKTNSSPMVIDVDEEDKNKELLVGVHEALINPGPDLIVCDEGHRIKNSQAGISQSLKNIRTRRRVVLTGYPLQNNLMEYWCMVDFVRPNYLGSKTEFSNMFERPINNGQCQDSTPSDTKLMRYRAHVLHSLLEGFVQRRGHTVLQEALPMKQEFIFLIRMSPIQRTLYREFMHSVECQAMGSWASTNPLKAFAVCCKIWNHPDILYKLVQKKKSITDDNDLDIDTESTTGTTKKKCAKRKNPRSPQPVDQYYPPFERNQEISYEWVSDLLKEYTNGLLESGGKMIILFKVLEEALAIGDKVLVFSQSLFTLDLLEEFLNKRKVPRHDMDENWSKNRSYFRLDGSTSAQEREKLINQFNSPENDKAWLFLLSTRAGSLGVNLIGANRVVVLDASWNPCHDCQAICRVFRFGQIKNTYIYRLVTDNTMEKKIYDRQVSKQGMSNRVVDEMQIQNHLTRRQVDNLLHYEDKDVPCIDFSEVQYDDPVMNTVLKAEGHWLTAKPFEHESLLIDKKELRLTKKEKRLAKQSYVMEKRLNVSYSRPSYAAFYPKGADGTSRPPIKIVTPPAQPIWASTSYSSRPVASVKPMVTTPVPMQPKGTGRGDNRSLPIISKNKPGVSVHKVITTTDIMLPGTATSTQSGPGTKANRIPAGQQIFIIKTPKGVYIRTNSGKIFAVRAKFPIPGAPISTAASSHTAVTVTESSTNSAPVSSVAEILSQPTTGSSEGNNSSLTSSQSDTPADIFASIYSQSEQGNTFLPRNDSSASLASQLSGADMLGEWSSDSNSVPSSQSDSTSEQTNISRYPKIAPNLSGMSSQMGPSSAMPPFSFPMGGGMGPSPYLFQNQMMYQPGNAYPQMPAMPPMSFSTPNSSTNNTQSQSQSSSVPHSNSETSNNNSVGMPAMQGMPPMQMQPSMMGFPFAPYPFPMPQPFLMHQGMDPSYMSQMQMPQPMDQMYNMGGMASGMGMQRDPMGMRGMRQGFHGNMGQSSGDMNYSTKADKVVNETQQSEEG